VKHGVATSPPIYRAVATCQQCPWESWSSDTSLSEAIAHLVEHQHTVTTHSIETREWEPGDVE
jgi:hypothetical protein